MIVGWAWLLIGPSTRRSEIDQPLIYGRLLDDSRPPRSGYVLTGHPEAEATLQRQRGLVPSAAAFTNTTGHRTTILHNFAFRERDVLLRFYDVACCARQRTREGQVVQLLPRTLD